MTPGLPNLPCLVQTYTTLYWNLANYFKRTVVKVWPTCTAGLQVCITVNYTQTLFMSPLLIPHPPFGHQTLRNGYTQLKITFVLSLSPLFISPKHNINVTIKGSCDIQRFLIFATHFANFLHLNFASLIFLMSTHHRPQVWHLLEVHLLFLWCHILHKTMCCHQVQQPC
jgi:hypothetical protein